MKIAAASLNQTPIDWANNKHNILAAISLAKSKGIDLLCLPEMCIPGYGCEDLFLHPWVADKSLAVLLEILPNTKDIATIVGLPYRFQHKVYNVICLIENGEILGFQAKQNLPKDGIHYETRWFNPWPATIKESVEINNKKYPFGDRIYNIKGKTIGFEICEDAWVADRPACRLAEENIDIILNPSASHFALMKSSMREQKVISASADFNCTYVFANQLGNEAGRIIYDGDAIIAHKGKLLANTPLFSFSPIELTWCDTENTLSEQNNNLFTNHNSKEEQFTAAISLGLFDYLRKSRSKGFVLSLSGGADSSTCLVLIAEMIKSGIRALGIDGFLERIGLENANNSSFSIDEINKQLITVAYQATANSSSQTLESAQLLASSVNAQFHHWHITDEINHAQSIIETVVSRKLKWETDDIVLQNIQARSRSPIIWMLANLQKSLLITTSNRSEGSVGYATMDGDTSGSLAPIAGINKPFIIHWLKWAEQSLGYYGLSKVNSLIPTAELRPKERSQSDEADLMPYEVLNQIEGLFVLKQLSPLVIQKELSKTMAPAMATEYVVKFFELWSRNQWKRERFAPSFHLDDYNIDPRSWFRFPILSSGFKNELEELKLLKR